MKLITDANYEKWIIEEHERRKKFEELADKCSWYAQRVEELKKEIVNLKEMKEKNLFANNYDYVILVKDGKTTLYTDGRKENKVRSINFDVNVNEIPQLQISR